MKVNKPSKKVRKEVYRREWYITGEGTYDLIDQAEAICMREQKSFNILMRDALTEFVQRHGQGNNSFQLDQFGITWTKAVSVTKCGFKDCGKIAQGIGKRLDTNQTMGFCSFHFTGCQAQKHLYTDMKWINTQTTTNNQQ